MRSRRSRGYTSVEGALVENEHDKIGKLFNKIGEGIDMVLEIVPYLVFAFIVIMCSAFGWLCLVEALY